MLIGAFVAGIDFAPFSTTDSSSDSQGSTRWKKSWLTVSSASSTWRVFLNGLFRMSKRTINTTGVSTPNAATDTLGTQTPEFFEQLAMGKCRFKHIILFGPPGVGKGAQAEIISRGYGLIHLSTGEMIRQAIQDQTPLGHRVQEAVEAGHLAEDDDVLEIIMDRIDRPEFAEGFVMDGFPRTVVQAQRLEKLMTERDKRIDFALFFTASEEVILERLTGRRVCKNCGSTYHSKFKRPKIKGVCDRCHGEVVQRHDDDPAIYQKRLSEYQQRTKPLVNFYKDSGVMVEVNAAQLILAVARDVAAVLDVPEGLAEA